MQLDVRYSFAKNCCQHKKGDKVETEEVQGQNTVRNGSGFFIHISIHNAQFVDADPTE